MAEEHTKLKTRVLIIGGGITGTGLARDLSLRGVQCLVVEKGHINSGTSGANHGLLHSGARYVFNDPVTARECRSESRLLKQLAPECCEDTGGLFVALAGDREDFIADFPEACARSGITAEALDPGEARHLEPELSEQTIAAFRVEDATVDPFALSYSNMTDAVGHGGELMTHAEVVGMTRQGALIRSVRIRLPREGRQVDVEAEQVVNAGGAWVGKVAEMAGLSIPVIWSKGSMLVAQQRLTERVINRLRPPSDGDIVVPGGTVSILGTTSVRVNDIDRFRVDTSEVDFLIEEAAKVLPTLHNARFIRAYAGIRGLIHRSTGGSDRTISRGSEIIDHGQDGLANFITVLSGKLTTFRLTAEDAADLVCARLGVTVPGGTRNLPLPLASANAWVIPAVAPKLWIARKKLDDALLCECEMVPMSAVAEIAKQLQAEGQSFGLQDIGLRSRLGKGSCQGAFCGARAAGFLYELGILGGSQGIAELRAFLESRWKGLRPVLWGRQLVQEQLQEAIHCGLFNLESWEGID